MTTRMHKSALFYHDEGRCVIPVVPRDKKPAIDWEEYQTRCSTTDEINFWFGNGHRYNVGLVHGEVSGGYVSLDFDHDSGLFEAMRDVFPELFTGRLEQSGSREGYHIPLILTELPDFGFNEKQQRPRGNKTWKTELGHCNIRARYCQTVAPPSIHPTGYRYTFIQKGPVTETDTLNALIAWLNELAPPPPPNRAPARRNRTSGQACGNTLLDAVKAAWPTAIDVFTHFGLANHTVLERNGETRLRGNGGLLIHADDPALWFNFSDEIGGDQITAWGWCRYGSAYEQQRHFRETLLEMAHAAGLDVARFYRRGDEQVAVCGDGDRLRWTGEYQERWEGLR